LPAVLQINTLMPTVAVWVQILSVRVPGCQKLQMMALPGVAHDRL